MNIYLVIGIVLGFILSWTVFLEALNSPDMIAFKEPLNWDYQQTIIGLFAGTILAFVSIVLLKLLTPFIIKFFKIK